MGNTAQQCRLGPFQDSDFAGDLEDSKSTSGGISCTFGSHTFVPISWMCKKQTSVSHSSTESDVIFLDAGLHMDGIPRHRTEDLVLSQRRWSRNLVLAPREQAKLSRSLTATISPSREPLEQVAGCDFRQQLELSVPLYRSGEWKYEFKLYMLTSTILNLLFTEAEQKGRTRHFRVFIGPRSDGSTSTAKLLLDSEFNLWGHCDHSSA